MKWENGDPVIFHILNTNYGNHTSVTYSCLYNRYKGDCNFPFVSNLKAEASLTVLLTRKANNSCVSMLLINLEQPQWVSVPCNKRGLPLGICFTHKNSNDLGKTEKNIRNIDINQRHVATFQYCSENHIFINNTCYGFHWYKVSQKPVHLSFNDKSLNKKSLLLFFYLYSSILLKTAFPLVVVKDIMEVNFLVKFYHISNKIKYYHANMSRYQEGFHTYSTKMTNVIVGNNLYKCKGGGYILFQYICDGVVDCPVTNSDELICPCNITLIAKVSTNICQHFSLGHFSMKCSYLFQMSIQGHCLKYFDENLSNNKYMRDTNGLLSDKTGSEMEYEQKLKDLFLGNMFWQCINPQDIPCFEGHPQCYKIEDICMYKLNAKNEVSTCINGAHLGNCKRFECSVTFKCPDSYCIPWSNVCDGNWDCSGGYDEMYYSLCQNNTSCKNMYKCRGTFHMCLHLGNLCNGETNCPFGDDEKLCMLKSVLCPFECSCLLQAIICKNISVTDIILGIKNVHTSIFIFDSVIFYMAAIKSTFTNTKFLKLPANNMKDICDTFPFSMLLVLDLGFNHLQSIKPYCFVSHPLLHILILNDNSIEFICSDSFRNLPELLFINISNNPITTFPEAVFQYSPKVKLFSAVNINLQKIHLTNFRDTRLRVVVTFNYRLCCAVPPTAICTAYKPWYIQCSYILPRKSVYTFIFISLMVLLINGNSIFIHILTWRMNKVFSALVISNSCANFLLVTYLSIIWISNLTFTKQFLFLDGIWKSGFICFLAFGTVLWYTILSQTMQVLVSVSRLMVVLYPFKTKFKQVEFIKRLIWYVFLICLLLAFALDIILLLTERMIGNMLCLPFIDPTKSIILVRVVTWVIVITQGAVPVITMFMHICTFTEMKKSKNKIRAFAPDSHTDVKIRLQLIFITLTNFACWIPLDVIYIVAMYLHSYSIDFIIWTVVLILPVNSYVIPLIYFIATLRKWINSKKTKNK